MEMLRSPSFLSRLKRDPFFWILSGIILGTFLIFHDSRWDLWAARNFYHPENMNPWFEEDFQPWLFFYHAAPWLTGLLLGGAFCGLWISRHRKNQLASVRRASIFVFLVVLIAPGLVINSILKPYWGRPRPREILELGGHHPYQSFYQMNFASGGKSFPCGHCSVGFSYGTGYFILRRRRPWIARGFLIFSLGFGLFMGIGRIAAGGHFLSDVIWAGIIVYAVAYFLSEILLAEKSLNNVVDSVAGEEGELSRLSRLKQVFIRNPKWEKMLYTIIGVLVIASLLLATPYQEKIEKKAALRKQNFIQINHATVEIENSSKDEVNITGLARGFGFPRSRAELECSGTDQELHCQLKKRGVFSDFESVLKLSVPFSRCQDINLGIPQTLITNFEELPECIRRSLGNAVR